jgi:hypothetical protein
MDADESRSTGCYLGFLQGGLIDFSSSVPPPVAMSTAEAELNYASITCMAMATTRQAIMAILYNDPSRPFTVPLFTDSQSMDAIALNDRDTRRVRHVDRRYFFVRYCRQTGQVCVYHINGDKYQLADIGTKSGINHTDFDFKLSHMEAPVSSTPKVHANYARRGVKKSPSSIVSSDPATRFIPGISRSPDPDQLPTPSHATMPMLDLSPTQSQTRHSGEAPTPVQSHTRHFRDAPTPSTSQQDTLGAELTPTHTNSETVTFTSQTAYPPVKPLPLRNHEDQPSYRLVSSCRSR